MAHRLLPVAFSFLFIAAAPALAQQPEQPQPAAGAGDRSPAALYATMCASCHGADHQGGNASSLADGVWLYGKDDGYVFRNIKFGMPSMGMPASTRQRNISVAQPGVSCGGREMTVQPAASAAATFFANR